MSIAKQIVESIMAETLNKKLELSEKISDNYRIGYSTLKDPLQKFLTSDFEEQIKIAKKQKNDLKWENIFKVSPKELEREVESVIGVKLQKRALQSVSRDGTISLLSLQQLIGGIFNDYATGISSKIFAIGDEYSALFH